MMYVRKTPAELKKERRSRKRNPEGSYLIAIGVFFITLLLYKFNKHGPSRSWDEVFDTGIWYALALAAIIYFFSTRSYEWTGEHFSRDERVCLGCNKVFSGHGSINRVLVIGRKKKHPWEIQACSTPELCDLARVHEVRWLDDNEGRLVADSTHENNN